VIVFVYQPISNLGLVLTGVVSVIRLALVLIRFVSYSQRVLVLTCLVSINLTAPVLEDFAYQTRGPYDCKTWIYH
jgi:hypothetical protein